MAALRGPAALRSIPRETTMAAGLVAAVAAVALLLAHLMESGSYDTFAAIPVGIGLLVVSIPLLRRAAALEVDRRVARLLWIALPLKLVASLVRYGVAFGLYDGQADAVTYHREGARLAVAIRDLAFPLEIGRAVQGTGFVQLLTGMVYSVTGATSIGGFLVFSWFGFWGLYLMYRALVRTCPETDLRRYAYLVFLLPSLLFWPSSIGKEAWMTLALGGMALGAARLLTRARGGLTLLVLGGAATAVVRPHVTAIFAVAVLIAYLFKRPPSGATLVTPIAKVLGVATVGVLSLLAINQFEDYLGVDAFDRESVRLSLEEVTRQTGQGGSQFDVSNDSVDPLDIPVALASIVIRPFPWEADSPQGLVASAEGGFLLLLIATSWRRIASALRAVIRRPYVVLCCTYAVLFTYGFSSFSNFGILVRQRVQVLPFLLVLVCLPPVQRSLRPVDQG